MSDDELLAKIEKDSLVMRHELVADKNAVFERLAKISNALRAVVEREEIEIIPTDSNYMGHYQVGYKKGYNQCLADIKADIAKELG